MKIWIISDTHGYHNQLTIPDCDLIIHCGDFTNSRDVGINNNEAVNFLNWYDSLDIKYKVLTGGNHDSALYYGMIRKEDWPNIKFLLHEQANINGIEIFGSPYSPRFGDWVFMEKRNRMDLIWDCIPSNTQILITHSPPKTYLDLTDDKNTGNIVQVGCKSLLNKVLEIQPLLHCFGHIHNHSKSGFKNYGIFKGSECKTTFVNAACLDHTGKFYNGHVIDLTK